MLVDEESSKEQSVVHTPLTLKVGTHKRQFELLCIVTNSYYFLTLLLVRERRFQRTKEHDIWIPYAKVMKCQSFQFGRCFKIISYIVT